MEEKLKPYKYTSTKSSNCKPKASSDLDSSKRNRKNVCTEEPLDIDDPDQPISMDEDVFELDRVIDVAWETLPSGVEERRYRVRWVGFSPIDDTWEPMKNFVLNTRKIVRLFKYDYKKLQQEEAKARRVRGSSITNLPRHVNILSREIESINGMRCDNSREPPLWFYLVAWKGERLEHATWESEVYLQHAADLIENYRVKHCKTHTSSKKSQIRPVVGDSSTAFVDAPGQSTGKKKTFPCLPDLIDDSKLKASPGMKRTAKCALPSKPQLKKKTDFEIESFKKQTAITNDIQGISKGKVSKQCNQNNTITCKIKKIGSCNTLSYKKFSAHPKSDCIKEFNKTEQQDSTTSEFLTDGRFCSRDSGITDEKISSSKNSVSRNTNYKSGSKVTGSKGNKSKLSPVKSPPMKGCFSNHDDMNIKQKRNLKFSENSKLNIEKQKCNTPNKTSNSSQNMNQKISFSIGKSVVNSKDRIHNQHTKRYEQILETETPVPRVAEGEGNNMTNADADSEKNSTSLYDKVSLKEKTGSCSMKNNQLQSMIETDKDDGFSEIEKKLDQIFGIDLESISSNNSTGHTNYPSYETTYFGDDRNCTFSDVSSENMENSFWDHSKSGNETSRKPNTSDCLIGCDDPSLITERIKADSRFKEGLKIRFSIFNLDLDERIIDLFQFDDVHPQIAKSHFCIEENRCDYSSSTCHFSGDTIDDLGDEDNDSVFESFIPYDFN